MIPHAFGFIKHKPFTPAIPLNYLGDQGVASRFLNAVLQNPDTAWAFVSKMYAPGLDLHALREVLWATGCTSSRVFTAAGPQRGGRRGVGRFFTRSLYVASPEGDLRRLLHLRMVKEPDRYGPWKICNVEQEDGGL